MDQIKKAIHYNNLLRIYGGLLSERQYEIADAYFSYDLSLSEIAESQNISRSAVEDALKKALTKLDELEQELKISAKQEEVLSLLEKAKSLEGEEKNKVLLEIERIIK